MADSSFSNTLWSIWTLLRNILVDACNSYLSTYSALDTVLVPSYLCGYRNEVIRFNLH